MDEWMDECSPIYRRLSNRIEMTNPIVQWIEWLNRQRQFINAYWRLSTLIDALSNNLWFQSNPRMNRRPLYCYIALWLLSFSNTQWKYIIFEELSKAGPTKFAKLQRVTVSQIVPARFNFFRQHLKLFLWLLYIQIKSISLKSIAFWFSRQFYLLLFLFLFLFLFWLATLKNGCMIISPSYHFVTISLLFRYYFVTISLLFITIQ